MGACDSTVDNDYDDDNGMNRIGSLATSIVITPIESCIHSFIFISHHSRFKRIRQTAYAMYHRANVNSKQETEISPIAL